jgi:hypothetical protein
MALIKSTPMAMAIHRTINLKIPMWMQKAIVKLAKPFSGPVVTRKGKCLVAWHRVNVRDDKKKESEKYQITHKYMILTWKTLQCEGKTHMHQLTINFTIFMECL